MKNPKRKISAASKYLLLLTVFSILTNTALGILLTRQSNGAIRSLMRSRMLDITETAASMIDGDVLRDITPEDAGTVPYESIMGVLTSFQNNIELSCIYCVRDAGGGNFVFGLDPSAGPDEFGTPILYTDTLYQASHGVSAVDDVSYEDERGIFYSAYSPVFDASGDVAGIVAVDFSREWFDAQTNAMTRTMIIMCTISLLISLAFALLLIRSWRVRVHRVNEQLNHLSDEFEALMTEIRNMAGIDMSDAAQRRDTAQYDIDELDSLTRRIDDMQSDLIVQIEKVHEQAYYDKTTGVLNKECYLSTKNVIDDMAKEGYTEFSILIFALNELTGINRIMGHEYGDMALRDIADILSEVYGRDRVFRIGGEEFTVIEETISVSDIQNGFSRVDFKLAAENAKEKPYQLKLSLSMGYAIYDAETDHAYLDVFRRADQMKTINRQKIAATTDPAGNGSVPPEPVAAGMPADELQQSTEHV